MDKMNNRKNVLPPNKYNKMANEGTQETETMDSVTIKKEYDSDVEIIDIHKMQRAENLVPKSIAELILHALKCACSATEKRSMEEDNEQHKKPRNSTEVPKPKKYNCPECDMQFKSYSGGYKHRRKKHPKPRNQCSVCSIFCSTPSVLREHELSHRRKSQSNEAQGLNRNVSQRSYSSLPSTSFDESQTPQRNSMLSSPIHSFRTLNYQQSQSPMRQSVTSHADQSIRPSTSGILAVETSNTDESNGKQLKKKYECEDCGKQYGSRRAIWEHRKKFHPGPNEPVYECSVCLTRWSCRSRLKQHKVSHLNKSNQPHTARDLLPESQSTLLDGSNMSIDFLLPPPRQSVPTHADQSIRPSTSGILAIETSNTDESNGKQLKKKYECEDCGKQYGSRRATREHRRKFHPGPNDPVYECSVCLSRWGCKTRLKQHEVIHLNHNDQPHTARDPSTPHDRTNTQSTLPDGTSDSSLDFSMDASHQAATSPQRTSGNTDENNNELPDTDDTKKGPPSSNDPGSSTDSDDSNDEQSESPLSNKHTCKTCDKWYGNRKSIYWHRRRVHSQPKDPIQECRVCGSRCPNAGEVEKHEITHPSFVTSNVCPVCNAKFKNKLYAYYHIIREHAEYCVKKRKPGDRM